MLVIAFPLLIAIVGLLMYAFSANPKLSEVGKILFFAGALGCVLMAAPQVTHWGGGTGGKNP